jgi:hypothetical protein
MSAEGFHALFDQIVAERNLTSPVDLSLARLIATALTAEGADPVRVGDTVSRLSGLLPAKRERARPFNLDLLSDDELRALGSLAAKAHSDVFEPLSEEELQALAPSRTAGIHHLGAKCDCATCTPPDHPLARRLADLRHENALLRAEVYAQKTDCRCRAKIGC